MDFQKSLLTDKLFRTQIEQQHLDNASVIAVNYPGTDIYPVPHSQSASRRNAAVHAVWNDHAQTSRNECLRLGQYPNILHAEEWG